MVDVGAQVVTAGGIYGEITSVEGDDVMLRIAPELEVRVARRAIGAIVQPEEPEEPEVEETPVTPPPE